MIPEVLIEKGGQMMDFLKKKGSKLKQKVFGRIHEQPTEAELEREALIEALLQRELETADPQTIKDIEETVQQNVGEMRKRVKGGEQFRSEGKSFTGATMGQNVNNRAARLREALKRSQR